MKIRIIKENKQINESDEVGLTQGQETLDGFMGELERSFRKDVVDGLKFFRKYSKIAAEGRDEYDSEQGIPEYIDQNFAQEMLTSAVAKILSDDSMKYEYLEVFFEEIYK
jgi:hypothetical protein